MENEKKKEIDLIDAIESLFKNCWNLLKKCVSGVGWFFRLIYKRRIVVLSFLIFGIVLGLYLNRTKVYRGEVEMKINSHDSYFYKNLIDPLFKQCKYHDFNSISKDFGISRKEAEKIINVKSFYYIDYLSDGTPNEIDYKEKFDATDTTSIIMSDRIRVVVFCSDTAMFNNMIGYFENFFGNKRQIVKENMLRKRQLDERINAVSNEIYMLDSLRRNEYFKRKRDVQLSTDKMLLVEREMKLYHEDLLNLEFSKQKLIWERDVFEDGVSFSSNFEVNPHPVNSNLKIGLIFGLVFFLIGSIVAMIIEKRKSIVSYLNKGV